MRYNLIAVINEILKMKYWKVFKNPVNSCWTRSLTARRSLVMIFMMSKETVKQLRLLSSRRKLKGKPRQTEISQQRLSLPVQQSSPHHSSSLEIIGETIPACWRRPSWRLHGTPMSCYLSIRQIQLMPRAWVWLIASVSQSEPVWISNDFAVLSDFYLRPNTCDRRVPLTQCRHVTPFTLIECTYCLNWTLKEGQSSVFT